MSYSRSTGCANRLTRLHNVKVCDAHFACARSCLIFRRLRTVEPLRAHHALRAIIRSRANDGGARRDRTDDLKLAKLALSQLSYGPVVCCHRRTSFALRRRCSQAVVGLGRLELPTSRLSSARSNQLSYKPDEASSSDRAAICARTTTEKEGKRRRRQGADCLMTKFGMARERSRNYRSLERR